MGLFYHYLLPLPIDHLILLEPDSLLRSGADLLTDHAVHSKSMGKTSALIYNRQPDLRLRLLLHSELADGTGGTDLTTKGTIVLTLPQLGDQAWGEHPFKPCLKKGGMKGVI